MPGTTLDKFNRFELMFNRLWGQRFRPVRSLLFCFPLFLLSGSIRRQHLRPLPGQATRHQAGRGAAVARRWTQTPDRPPRHSLASCAGGAHYRSDTNARQRATHRWPIPMGKPVKGHSGLLPPARSPPAYLERGALRPIWREALVRQSHYLPGSISKHIPISNISPLHMQNH